MLREMLEMGEELLNKEKVKASRDDAEEELLNGKNMMQT